MARRQIDFYLSLLTQILAFKVEHSLDAFQLFRHGRRRWSKRSGPDLESQRLARFERGIALLSWRECIREDGFREPRPIDAERPDVAVRKTAQRSRLTTHEQSDLLSVTSKEKRGAIIISPNSGLRAGVALDQILRIGLLREVGQKANE
jgi:hypothetical protein